MWKTEIKRWMWWNLFEIQTRSHIHNLVEYKKHETENYSGDGGKIILSKVCKKNQKGKGINI